MKKSMVVIGIDGLPWHLVRLLWKRRRLQNLRSLSLLGFNSYLESTIPPTDPTAWTSILTGVNPGRHGVFDLVKYNEDRTGSEFIRGDEIGAPRIHEILDRRKIPSTVINLPLSWPTTVRHGVVVSDWLSTTKKTNRQDLASSLSDYPLPKRCYGLSSRRFLNTQLLECRLRIEFVKRLLVQTEWRFSFYLFIEPDWLLHRYYDDIFAGNWKGRGSIELLEDIDDFLAWLREKFPSAVVVILSDHGFQNYRYVVHPNNILRVQNLLRVNLGHRTVRNVPIELKYSTVQFPRFLYQIIRRTPPMRKIAQKLYENLVANKQFNISSREIPDPEKSSAYMPDLSTFGLFVKNRKKTDVEELVKVFRDVRVDGVPAFSIVARKEAVYDGPRLKDAPDIILIPNSRAGFWVSESVVQTEVIDRKPPRYIRVNHNMHGMLIISGGQGLKSKGEIVSWADITPTILKHLDVQVPRGCEGHALHLR